MHNWEVWTKIPRPCLWRPSLQGIWWRGNLQQHYSLDPGEDHWWLPGPSWLSVFMQNTTLWMSGLYQWRIFIPVCQKWNQGLSSSRTPVWWPSSMWPVRGWRSGILPENLFWSENNWAICNLHLLQCNVPKHENNCHCMQWSHRMPRWIRWGLLTWTTVTVTSLGNTWRSACTLFRLQILNNYLQYNFWRKRAKVFRNWLCIQFTEGKIQSWRSRSIRNAEQFSSAQCSITKGTKN